MISFSRVGPIGLKMNSPIILESMNFSMFGSPSYFQIQSSLGFSVPILDTQRFTLDLTVNCSAMSDSATPWTVAHHAPLSVEFSRQEYWNRLPFSPPGDLPNPGIKPGSPALQADSFCLNHQGSSLLIRKWPLSGLKNPSKVQVHLAWGRLII